MKLRIESGGTVQTDLPDDLTGHRFVDLIDQPVHVISS